MHSILSAMQTYNYALAKWLNTKLKPQSLNRFTVCDIFEFASKIHNLEIANGHSLVLYGLSPCLLTCLSQTEPLQTIGLIEHMS